MKKIIISISIICFFISPSFSQQPTHKSGEIIVQLAKDNIIENVIFDYKKFNNKETNIELVKKLSNSLKIWLIKFDSKNINEINLLYSLKENPAIVNAQFNHKLEYRKNTPNDTLYHKQWQYENTGQLSGLPDADIDIDEAWEITTGGVTALGDTIVIAIVDDGFDTLHPDFTGNIWYNKNEIPNNGIDDDNNGYVDDYKGWNTYQGNDDIKNGKWGGEHGTSVTGIVGAKGNNTTGVSGVNWNVKMMIVVGGGYESDAISAYSYLLEMRKIYNQTDGEKGAYIVSSNSSWGVDFGKATDAPLWCAMYDSLGKYGIVNAAATSNMNIDVDVKGDLPSTCPSKYLICVTNTNNTDMKESAGYGVTHVDLGAPGEDVYTTGSTTFNAFGYEYFGGTSASSPHVAGVVGLLYASASKEFLEGTKFRPDSIAKLMRLFIMKGTDKNNSLIAKTVSGGRLNAFGAIQSMREFCDSTISIKSANANLQAVSIFPNPAHNNLIVRILSTNKSQIKIQITDICGRLLINEKIEMPAGRFDKSINISSLSTGIYLINIIDNKSNLLLHKKIIVR